MLKLIGSRIKSERLKRNLSIDEFASLVGVTDLPVKLWEKGKMAPRLSQIIKISEIFNVTTDYLFGLKDK